MKIIKSRIELFLFSFILLATILISSIASFFSLRQYFNEEMRDTQLQIEMLRGNVSQPIARALWMFDVQQIKTELNFITAIKRIEYAAITDETGVLYFAGNIPRNAKFYSIPLFYSNNNTQVNLGELKLAINSSIIYFNEPDEAIQFILNETFKVFIISLVITAIVHLHITRHLPRISSYIHSISTTEPNEPLRVRRLFSFRDELDQIIDSLNTLRVNLHSTENERRTNEEKLTGSLKEKEVLIKEIHHRVKNNLQIISSLMTLQEKYSAEKNSAASLIDMKLRIKSMALIHEKIYHSNNFNSIDFRDFTIKMLRDIAMSINTKTEIIPIVEISEITLSLDLAVPLALILNEMISNVYRFAFPENFSGKAELRIQMKTDGNNLSVSVSDNGVGLPSSINRDNPTSMGLTLINGLLKQIYASLQFDTRPQIEGTSWAFSFTVVQ